MENNQLNIGRPLLSVRRVPASPKNEYKRNENRVPVRPMMESCLSNLNVDPMMNTGSVPFGWEHSPGKPKNNNKQVQKKEDSPGLPKLPPGWFFKPKKKELDISVPTLTRFESVASVSKQSSDSMNDHGDEDNDADDESETFMDALDTLSRGETSFYNCSVSGVSGTGSEVKPSGIRPDDPKLREFMMGRFIPAAKAMVTDVPQHTFKKPVVKEMPREVKKLVNVDSEKQQQQLRYGPNFLEDVAHDKEKVDSDSDSDYHEHGNHSFKFCGLIPSFRSSNPVHGMCMRTKIPMSPASRTQASSSTFSSFSGSDNEPARMGTYEHRSFNIVSKSESLETTKLEGSKLYNRLQGSDVSRSEPLRSTLPKQNSSYSVKKGLTFKELLDGQNGKETDCQDMIVEKTLYVDTVQVVKSPNGYSPSSFSKPQSNSNGSLESDMLADESPHSLKTKAQTSYWKDPEYNAEVDADQDLKASDSKLFERPAAPPLPKSPSDSWLVRTLPSVSSKSTPTRWNPHSPSPSISASDRSTDKDNELPSPQGPLDPIPES
uniref:uncharacterized protein LOC122595812 n=1 Tax=Erigeron canadensis TaxID=72917 RepID=UPI001CB9D44E|nr:uncharacterized protein LOC122595812 [Erigeron canadensis]